MDLGLGLSGEGDLAIPLLNICANSTGVVQSLALQALKTWFDDHAHCIDQCIQLGAVPMLLSIMSSSLPEAAPGTPAAYTASMAVILIKGIIRHSPQHGGEAFLAAGGLDTLLHLMSLSSPDDKSLCLVLYLINDITRRSIDILDQSINAHAVPRIVSILKQPVSEATKFAALILNRWSLAAQHVPTIRAAGSIDALFTVLINSYERGIDTDTETIAYALSAISIMSQDTIPDIRSRLLSCKTSMTAISRAIAHYEGAFQGVGFPHAMLCMLLDGPEGAGVVASLAAWGLLSAWLSARYVSTVLVERACQPDTTMALDSLAQHNESIEASIALTQLIQHSSCFVPSITKRGHLERLTKGALKEFVMKTTGSCSRVLSPASSLLPADAHCMAEAAVLAQNMHCVANSSPRYTTVIEPTISSIEMGTTVHATSIPACIDMTSDPCTGIIEDPRPQLSMLLSSPSRSNSESAITVLEVLESTEESSRCISALASLTSSMKDSDDNAHGNTVTMARIGAPRDLDDYNDAAMGTEDGVNPAKRPRRAEDRPSAAPGRPACHGLFSRQDVGVPRYDTLCFKVGGQDVHAVGFVLEAHSSFLRGLLGTLDNVNQSISIPAVTPFSGETMHGLFLRAVEWCYTGKVEGLEDHEDAFNLWILAEFLQIDGLQRYCEAVLAQWFICSPDVLHHCLNLADRYPSAVPMRRLAAQFVLSFIIAFERCTAIGEMESAMAALIAAHATSLAVEMAEVVRCTLGKKMA